MLPHFAESAAKPQSLNQLDETLGI